LLDLMPEGVQGGLETPSIPGEPDALDANVVPARPLGEMAWRRVRRDFPNC